MDQRRSGPSIRVLLIDDHRVLVELLAAALSGRDGITVVGTAGTAAEGAARIAGLRPDVVVLDYDLPDADGVSILPSIRATSASCRVLMLTSYTDPLILNEAIGAGCDGFVSKRSGIDEIVSAVLAVASDDTPISADMVRSVVTQGQVGPSSRLTAREIEVLRVAAQGLSNREIAERLSLSVNTVRNHMQHVLTKLGAHSKLEAAAIGVRLGIVRR